VGFCRRAAIAGTFWTGAGAQRRNRTSCWLARACRDFSINRIMAIFRFEQVRLAAQGNDMYKFTLEKSVTELRRRKNSTECTVRISSADLDPAFEPAKSQYGETYGTGNGTDPIAYERGVQTIQETAQDDGVSSLAEVYQSFGEDSFEIQRLRTSQPRRSTPHWVRDEVSLIKFITSRLDVDDVKKTRRIPLRTLLDYMILTEFYLDRYSDEEIFLYYLDLFRKDRSGTRWTCSVKALKARRERLVKTGNLACREMTEKLFSNYF
jgi:hypothetical protein